MGGRRISVVVAVCAVVAVVAVAAVVAWLAATAPRPVVEGGDEPSTKRALAAVAVEVLGIRPTSFEVNPLWDVPQPLGLELRWDEGETSGHMLGLLVEPVEDAGEDDGCGDISECAQWSSGDGQMFLMWQDEVPEEDPGIVHLRYEVDGEARSATYAGALITGDPRADGMLPVSIERLEQLLTDPRFASTTTQQALDTEVEGWPADDTTGDAVPVTPAIVAAWMQESGVVEPDLDAIVADTATYPSGSVGATLRSSGHTTTVVLTPAFDVDAVCEAEWTCEQRSDWWGDATVGWRDGAALIVREFDDVIMVGTVESPGIDAFPEYSDDLVEGEEIDATGAVTQDADALLNSYVNWRLETTKAFEASAEGALGER